MSVENALWTALATRVIRVALERKGVSYSSLAETLTAIGVKETERSLISKVSRGTVKLTLLLQIIETTHAVAPRLWVDALRAGQTWEQRAREVITAEMAQKPWVTSRRVAELLTDIGVEINERTLSAQTSSGTLPLTLFLQCIAVLGSSSLDHYIDFPDLAAAALLTSVENSGKQLT